MSIYGHYKFSYILGYVYRRITRKSNQSMNSIYPAIRPEIYLTETLEMIKCLKHWKQSGISNEA